MSNNIRSILAILILVAILALTRQVMKWRFQHAAAAVVNDLKRKGALDEGRAATLPYAKAAWYQFGIRNYRRRSLEGLLAHGLIGVTGDGRYYLRSGANGVSSTTI
jgi:hypothetical protein